MIPKTIHYCWFGGASLPPEYKKYIDSWKRYLPGYDIKCWDESNFKFDCDYVNAAYSARKWAFVSDYARIKIIYEQGGIYLDTDVELIKPIDDIIKNGSFVAIEKKYDDIGINLGLGFGAKKGEPILGELLKYYRSLEFTDKLTVVDHVTAVFEKHGFERADVLQNVAGVTVYPSRRFGPIDCATGDCTLSPDTVSVHHYSASWLSGKDLLKKRLKKLIGPGLTKRILRLKRRLK